MLKKEFIKAPELSRGYLFRTPKGLFIVVDIVYEQNTLEVIKYVVHQIVPENTTTITVVDMQTAFNGNNVKF